MLIEIHGSENMLDTIRLFYEDQLQDAGYRRGPSVGSMEAGTLTSYLKDDWIVSIQVTEESETGENALRIEAEQDIAELYALWDAALITYGKTVMNKLMDFAWDKNKVEQGMK